MSQTDSVGVRNRSDAEHATKQILDQWGVDGWELVAGCRADRGRRPILKTPEWSVSARLGQLGIELPKVASRWPPMFRGAQRQPGVHGGQCRCRAQDGPDRQVGPDGHPGREGKASDCALNALAAGASLVGVLTRVTQVSRWSDSSHPHLD